MKMHYDTMILLHYEMILNIFQQRNRDGYYTSYYICKIVQRKLSVSVCFKMQEHLLHSFALCNRMEFQ